MKETCEAAEDTEDEDDADTVENIPVYDNTMSFLASVDQAAGTGCHKLLDWIPKVISNEWVNDDGVRNLSMIISLTGGAANKNSSGVECKITLNGSQFVISEQWSPFLMDIASFYLPLESQRPEDETQDEFIRRRFCMADQVRKMMHVGGFSKGESLVSVFRKPLAFQVDPMSLRVQVCGTKDGSRFCIVDLTEKQKLVVQSVLMLDSGRGRTTIKPLMETPTTATKYSSIKDH
jgi:hypothetical protein